MKRKCDNCTQSYIAKEADIKRGWGLCCSKSCAASKREKSKPGYNPIRVAINNEKRENWNTHEDDDCDDGLDYLLECGSRGDW